MSNLSKDLLFQYYGLGEESSAKRFLSVHQCIENVKGDEERLITEQTSLTTNEKNQSEEESQRNNDDCHKLGITNELYARSSRALDDIEDANEINKNLDTFNIDFGPNVMCNVFENTQFSAAKEQSPDNVLSNNVKTVFNTTDDAEANDLSMTFHEDTLPDSCSDVSSVTLKRPQKSIKTSTPLPPAPKKEPVCNETFVDFSNAGLETFPVEMLDKFSKLRMLYLENNNLTDLPAEFFTSLRHLEWLDVRKNQLTTLPANIKTHSNLETLLLQRNKIGVLPLELCLVPKLKTLHVTQNPLIVPPKDIVAQGCSAILNFLRIEWNKLHPEEQVKLEEKKIEPKPSTILCYQSPRRNTKRSKVMHSKSSTEIRDVSKKSIREKSRSYKPSNRCENTGANVSMEQRLLWIAKVKEIFAKQASILQKTKDEDVLKEWRRDKRSFSKAMEKAIKRNEDDIPFAIDFEDYSSILKQNSKSGKNLRLKKKEKSKFIPPVNINNKICELLESLNQLQATKVLNDSTPRTEQKLLNNEIAKILQFQDEIQNLRKYNDVLITPAKNQMQ